MASSIWRASEARTQKSAITNSTMSFIVTYNGCPLWVIRDRAIQRQCRPMSAVTPIDKMLRCRELTLCANSRQLTSLKVSRLYQSGRYDQGAYCSRQNPDRNAF